MRGWHPERFEPAENCGTATPSSSVPACMECAIVLGKRGFRRVHLVDAENDIGGIMRWIRGLPGRGEWAASSTGVAFSSRSSRTSRCSRPSARRRRRPRVRRRTAAVATGSFWAPDGLNRETHEPIAGADSSLLHVLTPEQIMVEEKTPPGKRVVVYDSDGYFMGPDLVEKLAVEGFEVAPVTSVRGHSALSHETLEQVFLKERLHEVGVAGCTANGYLERAEPGGDHLRGRVRRCVRPGGRRARRVAAAHLRDDALYHELRADEERLAAEDIEAVYRVGDRCVAPQLIADAIFDGHRLAREIDSENPAVPSFVRERPVTALV